MSRFITLSLLASLFLVDDTEMMDLGTYGSTFHEPSNPDHLPPPKKK